MPLSAGLCEDFEGPLSISSQGFLFWLPSKISNPARYWNTQTTKMLLGKKPNPSSARCLHQLHRGFFQPRHQAQAQFKPLVGNLPLSQILRSQHFSDGLLQLTTLRDKIPSSYSRLDTVAQASGKLPWHVMLSPD